MALPAVYRPWVPCQSAYAGLMAATLMTVLPISVATGAGRALRLRETIFFFASGILLCPPWDWTDGHLTIGTFHLHPGGQGTLHRAVLALSAQAGCYLPCPQSALTDKLTQRRARTERSISHEAWDQS